MVELGVNIDHVATLRQARREKFPDVIAAAKVCEVAGAHQITVHLRQDRRHIQDRDVELLKEVLLVRLNLEMAAVGEIIEIARRVKPHTACLVPENREEITTEGGLDVAGKQKPLKDAVAKLHDAGIAVSMFVEPDEKQIDASVAVKADYVELHTGAYANATERDRMAQLDRIVNATGHAIAQGLIVNAGHGLTHYNLPAIAALPGMNEVNIGHSIISRALFIGLDRAVKEVLDILQRYSA